MLNLYRIGIGIEPTSNYDEASIKVFISPSNQEIEKLKSIGIEEHDINSALDPEEVPRIEVYENGEIFIIWKVPKNYSHDGQLVFNVSSVGIFLRNSEIIFILPEEYKLFESKYIRSIKTPIDAMLGFMYSTINHYYGHIKAIKLISSEIEQKISTSLDNTYLLHMLHLGESLIYYINSLSGNQNVLLKIKSDYKKFGFSRADFERIKDIIIDNRQCYKDARIIAIILSDLMDARASIVNNNMGVLIKNLTIINIVMLPLNFLASIGGMSEYTMMTEQLGISWPIAYGIFLLFSGILGLGIAYLVNKYIKIFSEKIYRKK